MQLAEKKQDARMPFGKMRENCVLRTKKWLPYLADRELYASGECGKVG